MEKLTQMEISIRTRNRSASIFSSLALSTVSTSAAGAASSADIYFEF